MKSDKFYDAQHASFFQKKGKVFIDLYYSRWEKPPRKIIYFIIKLKYTGT